MINNSNIKNNDERVYYNDKIYNNYNNELNLKNNYIDNSYQKYNESDNNKLDKFNNN